MDGRVALMAGCLHFAAFLGFHAYFWPVGVQHVLTILPVIALLNLYLAAEQRRQHGLPYRGFHAATCAMALVSSLTRATVAVGPIAVLAHAVFSPGTVEDRRRRIDLWILPVFFSLLYPLALLVYGSDAGIFLTLDIPFFFRWLVPVVIRDGFNAAYLYALSVTMLLLWLIRAAAVSKILDETVRSVPLSEVARIVRSDSRNALGAWFG